jgi:hypothetical protein
MSRYLYRSVAVLAIPVLGIVASIATAPAAHAANPAYPFDWTINASTHLKKLDQTVVVPEGRFSGSVDLVTGDLTGDLKLPKATTTVQLAGIGLATATFKMSPTRGVTGHVDFANITATAKSTVVIKVLRLSPVLTPGVNLVGDQCKTSKILQVKMSGHASLTEASTFTGTYTIPPFETCGAATAALTQAVSGPGNSFTATASPR